MAKSSSRTLADLGESALIARIERATQAAFAGPRFERVLGRWPLRIGDDAAVLRPARGQDLVCSTDAQVEGVHFRFGRESARMVGRRAVCVNLSDLAAMGARPVGMLLSLATPATLPLSDFDGLIRGFVGEAARFECPLVGGNLTRAGEVSLHVSVFGEVPTGRALRRTTVRAGDRLFVTGVLGQAALARLRADQTAGALRWLPTPRLEAGRWLGASKATTACIDLSDGLATDLPHLLEGTGLGAEIAASELPLARGAHRAALALGQDALELAVAGGEDYELLFARRAGRRLDEADWLARKLGVPVREIGRVTAEPGVRGLPGRTRAHHF